MCSTDEVALVYAVHGTYLSTLSATGAEVVVYGRKIVVDGDCAVRTGLLTFHTADTAVGAELTCHSTLIVA